MPVAPGDDHRAVSRRTPHIVRRNAELLRILRRVVHRHCADPHLLRAAGAQQHAVIGDADQHRVRVAILRLPFGAGAARHGCLAAPGEGPWLPGDHPRHAVRSRHLDHRSCRIPHHAHTSRDVVDNYMQPRGGRIDAHGLRRGQPAHPLFDPRSVLRATGAIGHVDVVAWEQQRLVSERRGRPVAQSARMTARLIPACPDAARARISVPPGCGSLTRAPPGPDRRGSWPARSARERAVPCNRHAPVPPRRTARGAR